MSIRRFWRIRACKVIGHKWTQGLNKRVRICARCQKREAV